MGLESITITMGTFMRGNLETMLLMAMELS